MMWYLRYLWCPIRLGFLAGVRHDAIPKAAMLRMKAVGTGVTSGNGILACGVVGQTTGKIMYDVLGQAFIHVGLTSGKVLNGNRHTPLLSSLSANRCGKPSVMRTERD